MKNSLLALFDGNALIHRAYHALPPLTISKTGEMVNAVYGFTQMLIKALTELKPTHFAVAFDRAAPTFRHQLFEQYKAQRPRAPDELVNQFRRVREIVAAFHMPVYELDGYEADDVLGALSCQASAQGLDCTIVTGDADTMQLVSPHVTVLYPKPHGSFSDTVLYDEARVLERYGVAPRHIADLKALVGDPSDNIPGVHGVGDKTAIRLISQFGSIDDIYAHLDEVTPPRLQVLLRESEEAARQSKVLATIDIKTPVTLNLEECRISHYDRNTAAALFRELEFFSLLPRLDELEALIPGTTLHSRTAVQPAHQYATVITAAGLDALCARLESASPIALDTLGAGLDAMAADIVGISVSPAPGEAYYIPAGHAGLLVDQLSPEVVLGKLKPLLTAAAPPKVGHNIKYDAVLLAQHDVDMNNAAFDTMIAAHLLSEKSLSLKALAFNRLGIEMPDITDIIGAGARQLPISRAPVDKLSGLACAIADMTLTLAGILGEELKAQELWRLFSEVEMPLVPVLVAMERAGILLDADLLRRMSHELGGQLRQIESAIFQNVGHDFNINSPQQLSGVLFQELKLPTARKKRSTGAEILEELRGIHPVIELILEYRQLSKLKSTYIDALPALINPKTGRLHTSFNQTKTATGRLSSSDPNLQNIPVRGELGRQVRRAFIVPPGSVLLAADYSQIDLRVLAHLSRDETLLEAFNKDEDIHAATAARLFGVAAGDVTPDMRRVAKTVNFGVIYGMSEYGLEQATELSRQEAGEFINAYFEKYPGVARYMEATRQQARQTGYVQTLLGRRRAIPEVNSANRIIRQAAERMAINMPVQGTSADIIKVAMVNLYREMQKRRLSSKMLLQVHDELLFEVPQAELAEMRRLVSETMCTAVLLSVPLKVDIKSGANWGELE